MSPWLLHPVFVHFAVGLLVTGSALFIVSALVPVKPGAPPRGLNAAYYTFWTGIAALLFTAAAGMLAYFTVPGIDAPTRDLINNHVISAVATSVVYLSLALLLWRGQSRHLAPGNAWTGALVIAAGLLAYTGYLGGELVYQHGVGVAPALGTV